MAKFNLLSKVLLLCFTFFALPVNAVNYTSIDTASISKASAMIKSLVNLISSLDQHLTDRIRVLDNVASNVDTSNPLGLKQRFLACGGISNFLRKTEPASNNLKKPTSCRAGEGISIITKVLNQCNSFPACPADAPVLLRLSDPIITGHYINTAGCGDGYAAGMFGSTNHKNFSICTKFYTYK